MEAEKRFHFHDTVELQFYMCNVHEKESPHLKKRIHEKDTFKSAVFLDY